MASYSACPRSMLPKLRLEAISHLGQFRRSFWARVQKSQRCWIWCPKSRTYHRQGYGWVWVPGIGLQLAHRVAWLLRYRTIPRGWFILHRCDNPPCVRRSHLYLGRQSDNVLDMWVRGRFTGMNGRRHTLKTRRLMRVSALRRWRISSNSRS